MWDFQLCNIVLISHPKPSLTDLLGECIGHSGRRGWTAWTTASEFLEPILRGQRRFNCPIVRVIKFSDIQEIVKYSFSTPSVPSPVSDRALVWGCPQTSRGYTEKHVIKYYVIQNGCVGPKICPHFYDAPPSRQ